jgi:hypothetical protein
VTVGQQADIAFGHWAPSTVSVIADVNRPGRAIIKGTAGKIYDADIGR